MSRWVYDSCKSGAKSINFSSRSRLQKAVGDQEEAMEPESQSGSFYVSAPTSPRRASHGGFCFHSTPSSPRRNSLGGRYDGETEPATPETYEDAKSNFDEFEFEFETSRRFILNEYDLEMSRNFECPPDQKQKQPNHEKRQGRESFPAMAFADELFCNGQVMPLKLPPRLQRKSGNLSSTQSSPRSPISVLKIPFQRRSLWNDDFDPFMVALEKVREDNGVEPQTRNHRRVRSMSPIRAYTDEQPDYSVGWINQQRKQSTLVPVQNGQMGGRDPWKQARRSPIKLAEPKGILFARRARLVNIGHEKPTTTSLTAERDKEREIRGSRESNRQKIKEFLRRTTSMRKTSSEEKPKEEEEARSKTPTIARKFSFKSTRLTHEVSKAALIQYRPKLLLCLGYGPKYVK